MASFLRSSIRSYAFVAAVTVLVLCGPVGCGDDSDDGSTNPAGSAGQGRQAGGDERAGGAEGDKRSVPPALSGASAQARAGSVAVVDVYDSLGAAVEGGAAAADVPVTDTLDAAGDNEGLRTVCALMSDEAKRQTIVYAKRSAGLADVRWDCEKATALLLRRANLNGGLDRALRARVIAVEVDGDRATASVRFGGRGGRVSTVPLEREDGRWKLGSIPGSGR